MRGQLPIRLKPGPNPDRKCDSDYNIFMTLNKTGGRIPRIWDRDYIFMSITFHWAALENLRKYTLLGGERLREKTKQAEETIGVCVHVYLSVYMCKCAVLHGDLIRVSIQQQLIEEEKKKDKNRVHLL